MKILYCKVYLCRNDILLNRRVALGSAQMWKQVAKYRLCVTSVLRINTLSFHFKHHQYGFRCSAFCILIWCVSHLVFFCVHSHLLELWVCWEWGECFYMQGNLEHLQKLPTSRELLGLVLSVPLYSIEFRKQRVNAELAAKIITCDSLPDSRRQQLPWVLWGKGLFSNESKEKLDLL